MKQMKLKKKRFGDLEPGTKFSFVNNYKVLHCTKCKPGAHGRANAMVLGEYYFVSPDHEVYVQAPSEGKSK